MKRSIFEELKKINEHGQEYWSGRELGKALEYSESTRRSLSIYKQISRSLQSLSQSYKKLKTDGRIIKESGN